MCSNQIFREHGCPITKEEVDGWVAGIDYEKGRGEVSIFSGRSINEIVHDKTEQLECDLAARDEEIKRLRALCGRAADHLEVEVAAEIASHGYCVCGDRQLAKLENVDRLLAKGYLSLFDQAQTDQKLYQAVEKILGDMQERLRKAGGKDGR
jgi:hypothetical protein